MKQLHGAGGGLQRLLTPESDRDTSLPVWQGLISKWKRCADCEQPLPIPTYFGGSDKEREEIHTLPLGVQQRGDLLFQSLTGTFFFLSSFGSHLCFCYYIILFFFNKKVRVAFEQKQIFLENGSYNFLTFVLKLLFGVVIKGPL